MGVNNWQCSEIHETEGLDIDGVSLCVEWDVCKGARHWECSNTYYDMANTHAICFFLHWLQKKLIYSKFDPMVQKQNGDSYT